jgi:hypothetical protein
VAGKVTTSQRECFRRFRKTPRGRFWKQQSRARERGIRWNLTFDEWWSVWQESGKWPERGKAPHQYVMGRKGDSGAYALGNVEIITGAENAEQSHRNRWRGRPEPRPNQEFDQPHYGHDA